VADAGPSQGFRQALDRAHAIVVTPSNPFVSIDPILALPGIKDALRQSRRPVVAVSPIVGGKAVKGPLAKMMRELGAEPSALGMARHYGRLVDGWLIEDAAGPLRSVLNYCGSMDEARTRITACALKYHAQCNDEDIVIHQPGPAAAPSTDPPSGMGSGPS
jgi:2-phospho-L-lactate transferase/gluconeogenesis factor (CofD/UPF0052 family)